MTITELESKLKSALKNENESIYTLNDVYDWIYKNASDVKLISERLDPSDHKYFSSAMDVYQCIDGYLGIRAIDYVYNESTAPFDCDYEISVHQVYECLKPSYTLGDPDLIDNLDKRNFANFLIKNNEKFEHMFEKYKMIC